MNKKLQKVLLSFVLLLVVIYFFVFYFGFHIRNYQLRLIECQSEELFPELERVFDIHFPKNIKEVKTAKSISHDSTATYVVKFVAESNIIDKFLESVSKKSHEVVVPYSLKDDGRKRASSWFSPSWFTTPIQKGKKLSYSPALGVMEFYIDTSDTKRVVV